MTPKARLTGKCRQARLVLVEPEHNYSGRKEAEGFL